MIGHVVKFKRVDNGKYWIGGKISEGKYGPQIGMKMTPELRAYFNSVADGAWVNLSIDKPYEKRNQKPDSTTEGVPNSHFNDEIPFALLLPIIGILSLAVSFLGSNNYG